MQYIFCEGLDSESKWIGLLTVYIWSLMSLKWEETTDLMFWINLQTRSLIKAQKKPPPSTFIDIRLLTSQSVSPSFIHPTWHDHRMTLKRLTPPSGREREITHNLSQKKSIWNLKEQKSCGLTSLSICPELRGVKQDFTSSCADSPLLNLQHTLSIQRQTGGLGISIAGGKGSTPYKGDDEVRPRPGIWICSIIQK